MNCIQLKVNGVKCTVGSEVSSEVTLLDYLRNYLELRGTKYMCREGGCGACVVVATKPDGRSFAVNSCLMSVTSCQDWEITTIEGLGNRGKGYHVLQKTLAENDGTQCGYCSPGWVMAMYGCHADSPYVRRNREAISADIKERLRGGSAPVPASGTAKLSAFYYFEILETTYRQ